MEFNTWRRTVACRLSAAKLAISSLCRAGVFFLACAHQRRRERDELPLFPQPRLVARQSRWHATRRRLCCFDRAGESAAKLLTEDEARRIAVKYRQAAGANPQV